MQQDNIQALKRKILEKNDETSSLHDSDILCLILEELKRISFKLDNFKLDTNIINNNNITKGLDTIKTVEKSITRKDNLYIPDLDIENHSSVIRENKSVKTIDLSESLKALDNIK